MSDDRVISALRSIGISDPDELARAASIMAAATEGAPSSNGHAGPTVTELGAALAESGDNVALIGDVSIRVRPISTGNFMRFSSAMGGDEEEKVMAVSRLIRLAVEPADRDAAWDAMDAAGWSVEDAMGWLRAQVEIATGRPTVRPSPSPGPRPSPTPPSSGDLQPSATP